MIRKDSISRDKLIWSRITPEIYIGTNQLLRGHFGILKRLGISADIDLESERLEKPPLRGLDTFLWLPTKDGHAPTHNQLAAGAAFIRETVRHRKKVYVHCKNGHGRAPTLVASYLAAYKGMEPEEAVMFIKKRRPSAHLNKEQINAVKNFVRNYKNHS